MRKIAKGHTVHPLHLANRFGSITWYVFRSSSNLATLVTNHVARNNDIGSKLSLEYMVTAYATCSKRDYGPDMQDRSCDGHKHEDMLASSR